jgi:hypothetical protein
MLEQNPALDCATLYAQVVASYQAILGSLLIALWDARFGVATSGGAVISWTDMLQQIVLLAQSVPTRPVFGADGTANFAGRPVVQSAVSGSKCLITANLTAPLLLATGSLPWLWTVCRLRTIGTGSNSTIMQVVDNPVTRAQPVFFSLSNLLKAQDGVTTVTTPSTYSDLTPHAYAHGYSPSGAVILNKDTVSIATPLGSGLSVKSPGGAKLSLGAAFNGTSPSDSSFATLLAMSAQPSAAQQSALLAVDKYLWQF